MGSAQYADPIKAVVYYSIPEALKKDTRATQLNLRDQQLFAINDSIVQLTNLQLLVISGNNLTHLPNDIGKWQHLKTLIALNNPISAEEKERVRHALPSCQVYFDK